MTLSSNVYSILSGRKWCTYSKRNRLETYKQGVFPCWIWTTFISQSSKNGSDLVGGTMENLERTPTSPAAAIWGGSAPERGLNLKLRGAAAVKLRPAWCYNTRNHLPADLCGNKRHRDKRSISLKGVTFTEVNKQTTKRPGGDNNICRMIH